MFRMPLSAFVCLTYSAVAFSDVPEPTVVVGAKEAHQAVAVDAEHLYAIANKTIGKYDRETGRRVGGWEADAEVPLVHLNSGVVLDGKLYCAHSNYPRLPMTCSVEIWDAATMVHLQSIPIDDPPGSLTWIDRQDDAWWMCFAHYDGRGGDPELDHTATVIVRYTHDYKPVQSWRFPAAVLRRFKPSSCSGGAWGADGFLYCTGHDKPEVYVLNPDAASKTLELIDIFPFPIEGQGIAWDLEAGILFGIRRSVREIVGAPPVRSGAGSPDLP